MHVEPPVAASYPEDDTIPWYKTLTGYQWFVFIVCCLAWDMDCIDQQLFNLARRPAMVELVPKVQTSDPRLPALQKQLEAKASGPTTDAEVIAAQQNADIGDGGRLGHVDFHDRLGGRRHRLRRHGRPRWPGQDPDAHDPPVRDLHRPERLVRARRSTSTSTAFSPAWASAACSPPRSRSWPRPCPIDRGPSLIGLFQASSALGNCAAAGISIGFGWAVYNDWFAGQKLFGIFELSPWRLMFLVGIVPGLLVVFIQLWLKEPEKWLAQQAAGGKKGGSYAELLGDPRYRSRAMFGLILALAGVIGLWGIGFFSFDLLSYVMNPRYEAQAQGPRPDRSGRGPVRPVGENPLVRHHVAGAEHRRVLRHLRVQLREHVRRPATDVRRLLRPGRRDDGDRLPVHRLVVATSSG